jgi:amino acid adenylation domain-containing protein
MTVPPESGLLTRGDKQELLRRILAERMNRTRTEPASFAQERLWFLERMHGASALYNLPEALRLTGALNVAALERALGEIVRRHAVLRTVFREVDGAPVQVIAPFAGFSLALEDLSDLPADVREAEVRHRAGQNAAQPFDLAAGPLFRAALLRLSTDEHVLLLCMHHVITDAWSMGVFRRELSALYAAYSAGTEPSLAPLAVQYADFAATQRRELSGEALERQVAWWMERLAGAPALLELPTDRPRPAEQSYAGAREAVELPASLVEPLQALARAEGASMYMVLLAAFQVLLGRYAGSDDVVTGSAIAGRTRAETEGLIGFFVNTLALRTDLSGAPSFREVLRRVRTGALGAFGHQEVPFERLVAELAPGRSLSHAPLVQVMFALLEGGRADGGELFPGVRAESVDAESHAAKFDLTLSIGVGEDGIRGGMEYRTDLFDAATVRRMIGHMGRVLEQVAADADRPLRDLELTDADERALVVHRWNQTEMPFRADVPVHHLVEQQAARAPHSPAVAAGGAAQTCTYTELNARANRLAHHLIRLGVGAETRVGVCMERGAEHVVALLAVLKTGGAYVALDPAYPAERLELMLRDSGAPVLLTQSHLAAPAIDGVRIVRVDGDAEAIAAERADNPAADVSPRGVAYVVYTSGSTGTPKGVAVEHAGLAALCAWHAEAFGLTAADRCTQVASPGFDACAWEVWPVLSRGACLEVAPEETRTDPPALRDWLVRRGVTVSFVPTPVAEPLLALPWPATTALRWLLTGGDRLQARPRADLPFRLSNNYGPTECTVVATSGPVAAEGERAPSIGGPIRNTRIYVLDAGMRPLPVGVAGELCIGGAQVARGYLNRPSLTADRFVPDAFSGDEGARLYRTGDRVRWLADGTIEYLGRLDEQVKVRGFRIELGEIEATILRHDAVEDCVVIARGDAADRRLAAYVVGAVEADELRAHLRRTLPDYMVPADFVSLDAIPVTANGKVDRRALPEPDAAAQAQTYAAPRTPTEEVLAGIWAEVLRLPRVGIHDDFFALGGHSLLVTRVISRARDAFGIELPVRALFEAGTVAELAGRVEALRRADLPQLPPVEPVSRRGALPLSFAQERLWFLDRMQPGSAMYNIPAAQRLRGALDTAALERALGEIVRRHEALRTVFAEQDGAPVQVIRPFAGFTLPVEDLRELDAVAREALAVRRADDEAARPFDLAAGPLFRASLLELADDEHVLLLTVHHIAGDGWSMGVFFRELAALYEAFRDGGESPLVELPVQYADHAAWQRRHFQGEALDRQVAWWKERLSGAPELLEIPADHPRPAVQRHLGATEPIHVAGDLLARLETLARAEGATLYMVLLAAFQSLLSRYSGSADVVVGSTIAGRTRGETEPLIGLFMNTLALRTDLSGDPSLREVLRRVREVTLGAYEHQDVPFERLVEELRPGRSLSHSPLFQVLFELNTAGGTATTLAGVDAERMGGRNGTAKFDLSVSLTAYPDEIAGVLTYATDLFDATTARRMTGHLLRVLEQAAADPDRRLSRLDLVSDDELRRIEGWNATQVEYPSTATIHGLFEAQAARTPDATAVTFGAESLTYRELDARANALANHLARLGVKPEVRVGICLERSLELMVAILGVMKAGGAYVPVDPGHPVERMSYVLGDSGVAVVLTQEKLRTRVPVGPGVRMVCVDSYWPRVAADRASKPAVEVSSENLCYVIYTSGSTGRPKGVAMHHRGVCNYIAWGIPYYGADTGSGAPVFSSMAVDLTITNLLPLFAGLPVRMLPEESPVEALADVLREKPGFGLVKITPTHLSLLTPLLTPDEARGCARTLVIGADFLSAETTRFWQENAPDVVLMNEYGPTETVVGCSAYVLPNGRHRAGAVPVGGPIQNLTFHVLDTHLRPVPIGMPGELYIGGAGVARGYLGRPSLSAEKFVPDPFAGAGARMYRTGDRARWLESGDLMILGRTDNQVKVRGYRVELGEIEAMIRRHPSVSGALVVVREDIPGDRRLVAYVAGTADAAELREHLRRELPEYMVPSAFVTMDALPQTATGKLDPKTLPAPEYASGAAALPPRNEMEQKVAEVWKEVLGLGEIAVSDNFFDLGGTSLLLYRVYSKLREIRGDLRVVDLFRHTTVEALAEYLGTGAQADTTGLDESRSRAAERRALRSRRG